MPTRRELANAIRVLSMDAVQQANSGHPGAPMGMADIAEVLWNDYMCHNPADPLWPNRDRFVLSNGHGSMLIYSLLHLSGYDLPISELKNFRQLHSKTPGHPEYGYTPGVETTTGPLGQGVANAVGMAIAEKVLAAQYNRDGHKIIDHYTYVFMGDGCMMEGISHEVCSLAATLGLGKLIVFYDDNGISIDGRVDDWFTDDTAKRFQSYGWQVVSDIDGHDDAAIRAAIDTARGEINKPTLICCKTLIGWGAPNKQGSAATHGSPLGADEVAVTRSALAWNYEPFVVPEDIYESWDARVSGSQKQARWQEQFVAYSNAYPTEAAELERRLAGDLPDSFASDAQAYIAELQQNGSKVATRKASQNCLDRYGQLLPELVGGSADLTPSNLTRWSQSVTITAEASAGNYLHFGVREFGMSAICNGIALHGGFIPYNATFLVFTDYARNAVRMAAIMKQRNIFVYTHDSIGLGEDGPTHQPIEQMATLRMTPNMSMWRPCDDVESAVAWKAALERRDGPTSLVFSRQGLEHQARTQQQLDGIARGGYVLADADQPLAVIIATGSEVALALAAAEVLGDKGKPVRVVSMPSTDVFEQQEKSYQAQVLPPTLPLRVAVEAGVGDYWYKYVGLHGAVIGMTSFGESAPAAELFKYFGFTVEKVVSKVEQLLSTSSP